MYFQIVPVSLVLQSLVELSHKHMLHYYINFNVRYYQSIILKFRFNYFIIVTYGMYVRVGDIFESRYPTFQHFYITLANK